MTLDPKKISFRPLELADLPLLHRWLNTDFVKEWYDSGPPYEEVVAKYAPRIAGRAPTRSFVTLYGGTPIGYIQTYRIDDYPEYSRYVRAGEEAAGVDLFIGHADYVHRGLGSAILRRFLREVVFGEGDTASCVIGPSVRNRAAIRAYEKAGFTYLKTVEIPDEDDPEYLMRLARDDLAGERSADEAAGA
jgi:RimJ/RimL family protein N-acetyltransferase